MADKAIVDKAISDLTQATQITGDDLFVLEQGGEAKKLKGSQVVQYAKDSVAAEVQGAKEYADSAKASADAATKDATRAETAAQGIDDKVAAADASAKAAASSAAAAAASATGIDDKVQAAQTAATNAAKSETAAKDAQTGAVNAQKAAETAQTGAQAAKTTAESAQEAAESAKDAAAVSSTSAGQKASQAAQSAEDAASAKSAAETAKTDAQAARDAIVNMIVEAVTLASGSDATVSKSVVDNVFKLVFGIPRGNPGADAPTITGITIRQSDYHMIVSISDGTTYDAGYCRGAAGAGSGDMLAAVYDPNGKHQDIFAYVDNAIKDVKVTTDATPTQGSTNPVQSGGVYSELANKLDKTGDGSNVTAAFTAASTRANIATGEKLSVLFGKIAKWLSDLGSLAFKSTVAKSDLASDVQMSLGKADSALQSYTESDPTVPEWAKAEEKPSYSKSEVGLGNVDNVKQYSASNPPPYPVTSVNGKTGAVTIASAPSTTAMLKGNGSGGLVAATRGSDYIASGNIVKQTLVASESTPTENFAINWVYG